MQRGQVQLQGIPFPYSIREQGASVELVKFEIGGNQTIAKWAQENLLEGDRKWGIIAQSKSKEENQFLSLSFKKVQRTRLRLQNGRVERIQEEAAEPEIGEFHQRQDGILELYSYGAKQRTALTKSLSESFGDDCLGQLFLEKDAMKSLMTEAIEVNSVSLTSLGNPFFNDATFSGTDPTNSKTYKELSASGEIKSFRGKFQSGDSASAPLIVTVHSNCKLRFFGGQEPVAQSDIEDFEKEVIGIASDGTMSKVS
jgi:hypothetical protein